MFLLAYAALWTLAHATSPRAALPCFGTPLRMQSPLYCALNRHYVTAELASVAQDAATHMAATQPGTITLALDGGFPFLTGMPLIPHLSHDDGEKLDFAFYYPMAPTCPAKPAPPSAISRLRPQAPTPAPPAP